MSDSENTPPETPPSSPPSPPSSGSAGTPPEPPTAPPPSPPSSEGAAGAAPPPPPGSPPAGGGGSTSPNRGLMLVLSYLGILALIPFFIEKDDREVQWHAKHGLVLFGAEIAVLLVAAVLFGMLAFIDLGCSGCIFNGLFALAVIGLHIACIVKAVNGERLTIPGISPLADRF